MVSLLSPSFFFFFLTTFGFPFSAQGFFPFLFLGEDGPGTPSDANSPISAPRMPRGRGLRAPRGARGLRRAQRAPGEGRGPAEKARGGGERSALWRRRRCFFFCFFLGGGGERTGHLFFEGERVFKGLKKDASGLLCFWGRQGSYFFGIQAITFWCRLCPKPFHPPFSRLEVCVSEDALLGVVVKGNAGRAEIGLWVPMPICDTCPFTKL